MQKNSYSVNLHITKVNAKGKSKFESQDFEFASDNLIENRRNAITKAKELFDTIEDYLPKGEKFSSAWEAEQLNYKGFNCFSVAIYLHFDGEETPIYGDEEKEYLFESWEYEAQVFKKEYPDMKFTIVKNFDGEEVEVIEEDSDFLIYDVL